MNSNNKYCLAINKTNKISAKLYPFLKKHFQTDEAIWQASLKDLVECGLSEKQAEIFLFSKKNISPDKEVENLNKLNLKTVHLNDFDYPQLLKQIYYPPYLLYYHGNLKNITAQTLAVVGTRKISNYGKLLIEKICPPLTEKFIIVSGLALGTDSLAHYTAVKAEKTTIAVLGNSLDRIYPATNRYLADQILYNNGLILSEFPLGTEPLKHHFPMRNRIISGLSKGVLIIEADEKSGSLITANYALEQNREIFAIPGNINQVLSKGTNLLIKKGAKLVMSANDIFEEFDLQDLTTIQETKNSIPDSPEEAHILKFLDEPLHINTLAEKTNLKISDLNAKLTMLEMKGLVRNIGNMTYSKT